MLAKRPKGKCKLFFFFGNILNASFLVISPAFQNNLAGSHFLKGFRKPEKYTFILDYSFPPPHPSLLMTKAQEGFQQVKTSQEF